MQSTGQTSTQEMSFVPMHGSLITYANAAPFRLFTGAMCELIASPLVFLATLCKTAETHGSPGSSRRRARPADTAPRLRRARRAAATGGDRGARRAPRVA